jgi:hypothetical protein
LGPHPQGGEKGSDHMPLRMEQRLGRDLREGDVAECRENTGMAMILRIEPDPEDPRKLTALVRSGATWRTSFGADSRVNVVADPATWEQFQRRDAARVMQSQLSAMAGTIAGILYVATWNDWGAELAAAGYPFAEDLHDLPDKLAAWRDAVSRRAMQGGA